MGFYPNEIPGMLPVLLQGLRITVTATVVVMGIALVLGLPIALARMSRNWLLRTPATVYVQVLRGTPALLQLFYRYYVLPFAGLTLPTWPAGILGMSAGHAGYRAEPYPRGLEA